MLRRLYENGVVIQRQTLVTERTRRRIAATPAKLTSASAAVGSGTSLRISSGPNGPLPVPTVTGQKSFDANCMFDPVTGVGSPVSLLEIRNVADVPPLFSSVVR